MARKSWEIGPVGTATRIVTAWRCDRDDQIGCPIFAPIDEVEAHLRRRAAIADARIVRWKENRP